MLTSAIKETPAEAGGVSELGHPEPQYEIQGDFALLHNESCSNEDELAGFLSLIQYDAHYRVDEVLKESPSETTQKVTFVAENGTEQGPFIRKYLKLEHGLGSVYKDLYRSQKSGACFSHLPRIYALYQLKDELVVVMQYVQGETLQDVVFRLDPSPELAMEVFPQVCDAVRELHEGFDPPIIHRDLKPTNLILSWGKVTLLDFGIARVYREGSNADTAHFGTRSYAPPEQFGFGQTDVRSDVYALGMLLFYCLTERAANQEDRDSHFQNPGVPEAFRKIIARACSFDPADRFSSVAELQRAFSAAVSEYCKSMAKSNEDTAKSSNKVLAESALYEEGSKRGSGMFARIGALVGRIPASVGIAWNVMLWLFWLLVAVVCVTGCFWPQEGMPEVGYPLWFRIVEYLVFFLPSATCIAYELSDRRILRRKVPALRKWPLWLEFLLVAVAAPFVLAIVMTFCAKLAGLY